MIKPLQSTQLELLPEPGSTIVNYNKNKEINDNINSKDILILYNGLNPLEKLRFIYYLLSTNFTKFTIFYNTSPIIQDEVVFLVFILRPYIVYLNNIDRETKKHIFVSLLSPSTLYTLADTLGKINLLYRNQLWQQMTYMQQIQLINICTPNEQHNIFSQLTPQQQNTFVNNSIEGNMLSLIGLVTNISLINPQYMINIYLMIPDDYKTLFLQALNPFLNSTLSKFMLIYWWKQYIVGDINIENGKALVKALCDDYQDNLLPVYYPLNGIFCNINNDYLKEVFTRTYQNGDSIIQCVSDLVRDSIDGIIYSQKTKQCSLMPMCSTDYFILNSDIQYLAKYKLNYNYSNIINTFISLPKEDQSNFINIVPTNDICKMLFHIELSYVYTEFTKNTIFALLTVEQQLQFNMLPKYNLDILLYNVSQTFAFGLESQIFYSLNDNNKKSVLDELNKYRKNLYPEENYIIIADNLYARLFWNNLKLIDRIKFIRTLTLEATLNFYMKLSFTDKVLFFTLLPPFNGLNINLQNRDSIYSNEYNGNHVYEVFANLRRTNIFPNKYPPSYLVEYPKTAPQPPQFPLAMQVNTNFILPPPPPPQSPPQFPYPIIQKEPYLIYDNCITQSVFLSFLSVYEVKALLTFIPNDCWKIDEETPVRDIILNDIAKFQNVQPSIEKYIVMSRDIYNDLIPKALEYYQTKVLQMDATIKDSIEQLKKIAANQGNQFPELAQKAINALDALISNKQVLQVNGGFGTYITRQNLNSVGWCGTPETCANNIIQIINNGIMLAKNGMFPYIDAQNLPNLIKQKIQDLYDKTNLLFNSILNQTKSIVDKYVKDLQAAIKKAEEDRKAAERAAFDRLPLLQKIGAWISNNWKFLLEILITVAVLVFSLVTVIPTGGITGSALLLGLGVLPFLTGATLKIIVVSFIVIDIAATVVGSALTIATASINYACGK